MSFDTTFYKTKKSFKYLGIYNDIRKEGGFQEHQRDFIPKLEKVKITAKNMKENMEKFLGSKFRISRNVILEGLFEGVLE